MTDNIIVIFNEKYSIPINKIHRYIRVAYCNWHRATKFRTSSVNTWKYIMIEYFLINIWAV